MKPLSETDLILNPDGSLYHLHVRPEDISDTILTVGDPHRVEMITRRFDRIDFKQQHREFVTHTGSYQGKRLSVMSTGMGTDNIDIFLTELDALVNVDLDTLTTKKNMTRLHIIRIGTSASMQENIPVDSLLVSEYAVGMDTLMCYYDLYQSEWEQSVSIGIKTTLDLPFEPYCVPGSPSLKNQLAFDMVSGNTVTCPGFYGPQGRKIRAKTSRPDLIEKLSQYKEGAFQLTNFEMETAGYYAMGRLLGHEVISLNAILANRVTERFSLQPEKVVDDLIQKVLDRI